MYTVHCTAFPLAVAGKNFPIGSVMCSFSDLGFPYVAKLHNVQPLIVIDGKVCWHSIRRLLLIVCRPRKTNFIFSFLLQQTNGSLPFPFSVCSKQMEIAFFRQFCFLYTYIDTYICAAVSNQKRKTENGSPGNFSSSVNPVTYRENRSLSFVRLLMKKQT